MTRVLPMFTLVLLLMTAPAVAIPVCPSGTMADYIAFGSTGCNLNNLTFLNFSYSGIVRAYSGQNMDFFGSVVDPSPPPSAVSVLPFSNGSPPQFPLFFPTAPNLGSGGGGLRFSVPTPPFGAYWQSMDIGFEVFARTGPGIVGNTLGADLRSVANLQSASIGELTSPGGQLGIHQGVSCFGPAFFEEPFCRNPQGLSLPFTRFQEIHVGGSNVGGFEAGFATPEPATLLLVGSGAAGLGLARWVKKRRRIAGCLLGVVCLFAAAKAEAAPFDFTGTYSFLGTGFCDSGPCAVDPTAPILLVSFRAPVPALRGTLGPLQPPGTQVGVRFCCLGPGSPAPTVPDDCDACLREFGGDAKFHDDFGPYGGLLGAHILLRGVTQDGERFWELATTPEPATLLLVGTGAAGLGLVRWVKRRHTSGHGHESSNIP